MHGGGHGNDDRAIEPSGNGSGTSNPQLWENYYCNHLGLSYKTAVIFCGKFFLFFRYDPCRENENKLSQFIFVICCFSTNIIALSRKKS